MWLQICAVIFTWPLLEDLNDKREEKKVRISLVLKECPFSALLEHLKFLFGALNILILDLKELIDG